jgi:uncharacterized membrane protein (DUF2068 family)
MKLSRESSKTAAHSDTAPAARLNELLRTGSEDKRAGFYLVVFMRLLAGIWVIQGLLQWSAILLPPQPLFDNVTALHGAAIVSFAVLDLVAAVGLWLATAWGGAIWLLSAIAQIIVALALPGFFSILWIGADIALIVIYFVLSWRARHIRALHFRAHPH